MKRTGERRSIVRDADNDIFSHNQFAMVPERRTLDKGRSYVPRSVYRIDQRDEYYGVLKDEFQLNIRFRGTEKTPIPDEEIEQEKRAAEREGYNAALRDRMYQGAGQGLFEDPLELHAPRSLTMETETERSKEFAVDTSYRHLHSCLWDMAYTTSCSHITEIGDQSSPRLAHQARLGLGAATSTIFGWCDETSTELGEVMVVPERICILLVKGDRRARWLAVAQAACSPVRRTMLCTRDCCEDCALDFVSQLEGKWLLII